jgi:hypothetical protein
MFELSEQQRSAVLERSGQPVRFIDPVTHEEFVLISANAFQALTAMAEQDRLSRQEQQALLLQAGLRAGWDDPEFDVYDELDPRRS